MFNRDMHNVIPLSNISLFSILCSLIKVVSYLIILVLYMVFQLHTHFYLLIITHHMKPTYFLVR